MQNVYISKFTLKIVLAIWIKNKKKTGTPGGNI